MPGYRGTREAMPGYREPGAWSRSRCPDSGLGLSVLTLVSVSVSVSWFWLAVSWFWLAVSWFWLLVPVSES